MWYLNLVRAYPLPLWCLLLVINTQVGFKKLKLAKGLCTKWCNGNFISAELMGRALIDYKHFFPHSGGVPVDLDEDWILIPYIPPSSASAAPQPSPQSAPTPVLDDDSPAVSNKHERSQSVTENPSRRHRDDRVAADEMDVDGFEKPIDEVIDISDSDGPDDKKPMPEMVDPTDDMEAMEVDTKIPSAGPKCDHSADNALDFDEEANWLGIDVNRDVVHVDEDGNVYRERLLVVNWSII
jgi:hypothetical protein